jgi:Mrp family chromosome partitioning ATPase
VEAGVRFVEITCPLTHANNSPWDQHGNLKQHHAENAMITDQSVAGLIYDLKQRGLLDALADKSLNVESFVLPTDINGLSILSAGTRSEGATELIASSRMGTLVSHLLDADPRRIVLFDSSPLLVSSESRELSKFVGQVLLVVRASKTPQRAVLDAVHMLGDEVAVGLVLNQGRPSMLDGIYGYGYGYGAYGDYGNDTPVQ